MRFLLPLLVLLVAGAHILTSASEPRAETAGSRDASPAPRREEAGPAAPSAAEILTAAQAVLPAARLEGGQVLDHSSAGRAARLELQRLFAAATADLESLEVEARPAGGGSEVELSLRAAGPVRAVLSWLEEALARPRGAAGLPEPLRIHLGRNGTAGAGADLVLRVRGPDPGFAEEAGG